MLNGENIDMKEARVQANEMLRPIREKVQEQQALIKTIFERELSPKQFNTWIKYQEKKQNELKPKNLENPQMPNSAQHSKGRGQKQGMGRAGY